MDTSFNTANSNSDESISEIINQTIDDFKKNIDIREYMDYKKIQELLINDPIEMSLLEIIFILINNNLNEKKR